MSGMSEGNDRRIQRGLRSENVVQDSTADPTPAALTDPTLHVRFPSCFLLSPKILLSGAVAQLGARVNGIHEVAGSIPASSTNYS